MWCVEGVPEFKRHVCESERDFLYRVDCETRAVINQSQLDDKYQRSTTNVCIISSTHPSRLNKVCP